MNLKNTSVVILTFLCLQCLSYGQTMRNATLQPFPIIGLFKIYEIGGRSNWIGPFATILIEDVKGSASALEQAKSVRVASFFKTGGLLLTPVFLFSAVGIANEDFDKQKEDGVENPEMPGTSKFLLGMTLASFIAFVAGDIAENAFLTKTADAWNSGYGAEVEYSMDGVHLSFKNEF